MFLWDKPVGACTQGSPVQHVSADESFTIDICSVHKVVANGGPISYHSGGPRVRTRYNALRITLLFGEIIY